MYYFTADEHYNHANVIRFCDRPFETVDEMNKQLIENHNEVVTDSDTTIHAGDFAFGSRKKVQSIIDQLNGNHIFLNGSHDKWLKGRKSINQIWEQRISKQLVVICHYCMRTWAASHYNSWHLYGHSHGQLPSIGKSHDIGVDSNDFMPYSWYDIKKVMETKPDNPNLIKGRY